MEDKAESHAESQRGMTLYQITNQFLELMDADENGIPAEQLEKINQELTTALQTKSTNIIAFIKNREALTEGIDEEIKRLQDYKSRVKTQTENFKEYVQRNMDALGIDKIETELGIISQAKNPISVEITDAEAIPRNYWKEKTEITLDKKKLIEDFKTTGELIPGVKFNTSKKSLRIR